MLLLDFCLARPTRLLILVLMLTTLLLHTREIMSCQAVARAQHFGQNGRFPQQPRMAWLRAT